MKGGFVYGETDKRGFHVEEDEVSAPQVNATIAKALGLPLEREVFSDSGRPFKVAKGAKPIDELFA